MGIIIGKQSYKSGTTRVMDIRRSIIRSNKANSMYEQITIPGIPSRTRKETNYEESGQPGEYPEENSLLAGSGIPDFVVQHDKGKTDQI